VWWLWSTPTTRHMVTTSNFIRTNNTGKRKSGDLRRELFFTLGKKKRSKDTNIRSSWSITSLDFPAIKRQKYLNL
jgi:hypothetical protein